MISRAGARRPATARAGRQLGANRRGGSVESIGEGLIVLARQRVAELEERQDFTERVLARQREQSQLDSGV